MHATMRQSLTRQIVSVLSTLLTLAEKIWDDWGIQLLVAASFFCQVILVHLGGRRRYCYGVRIRFSIWASYMLASNIAAIALGKLTFITIQNPKNLEYEVELQALLAPLLLMHLGYPDSISAYSVEDTHMGKRCGLKLLVHVGLVIWILVRCFDSSSPISKFLYIPLFIAGIIEPIATIIALSWVYDDTTSAKELKEVEDNLEKREMPDNAPSFMKHVLMAYHRFDSLRPHRANWFYRPAFVENNWMSLDGLDPKDAFHVTKIELGFVFDAMFTHSPMVCTMIGLGSRLISISLLVSALIGFSIIIESAFLLDTYAAYTYALLIGSVIMELHQIITLPFSYPAVVALWRCKCCTLILKFLIRVCDGQKMWSNSLGQLNLVEYCLKNDFLKLGPVSCILSKIDKAEKIKKYWRSTHETVPLCLKVAILKTVQRLEEKRKNTNNEIEGVWTWTLGDISVDSVSASGSGVVVDHINMDNVKYYMTREFDKCIIIWHIATDALLSLLNLEDSSSSSSSSSMINCCCPRPSPCWERERENEPMMLSKLLSNYMMYLLMDRPYLLSLTTGGITIGYASSKLKAIANQISKLSLKQQLQKVILQTPIITKYQSKKNETDDGEDYKTFITKDWDVLGEVKDLVTELQKLNNGNNSLMWELITSVWIEMLCYAAYKSRVYQHLKMLRRGGELITHVWLLLLHKTDKFPYPQPNHRTIV